MRSEGKPISRKDFLLFRNYRAPSSTREPFYRPSSIETYGLNVDGPLRIGNKNLYTLMSDHDRGTWERDGQKIEKLISQFPVVIPEYRPSEYKPLENDPLIRDYIISYREHNYLFNEVEESCTNQGKEVYVLDPAYDLDFIKLRPSLAYPEMLTLIMIPYSIAGYLAKLKRREFLMSSGLIITLSTFIFIIGKGVMPLTTIIERDLRNNVVAKFVADLSKLDELAEQDVLLIYPEKHWLASPHDATSIKTYLENDAKREARFNLYKNLFGNIFPSFFQIRHYPPKD